MCDTITVFNNGCFGKYTNKCMFLAVAHGAKLTEETVLMTSGLPEGHSSVYDSRDEVTRMALGKVLDAYKLGVRVYGLCKDGTVNCYEKNRDLPGRHIVNVLCTPMHFECLVYGVDAKTGTVIENPELLVKFEHSLRKRESPRSSPVEVLDSKSSTEFIVAVSKEDYTKAYGIWNEMRNKSSAVRENFLRGIAFCIEDLKNILACQKVLLEEAMEYNPMEVASLTMTISVIEKMVC